MREAIAAIGGASKRVGTAAYREVRRAARRLGLGRLLLRMREPVRASPWWIAVPPRQLKDLDQIGIATSYAVALTFDDGPDPVVTPELLDLLESYDARATFFMCGLAAQRYPQLVKEIVAAGHTIGGHSWDHRPVDSRLTEPEWRRQIDDTHALLADLSGRRLQWFRPPRGLTDRKTWQRLRRAGVTTVLWSAAGRDWTLRDPELIAASVLEDLDSGSIVLLHDSIADFRSPPKASPDARVLQKPTIEATEIVLQALSEHGWEAVGLDSLSTHRMPRAGRPRVLAASAVQARSVTGA